MTGLTRATALPRSRAVDPTALLTALWLGALVVATWPVAAAAAPLALLPLAVHVCAVLAGYGVLVLLVVIARSSALERGSAPTSSPGATPTAVVP
jgi:hypothetical protein